MQNLLPPRSDGTISAKATQLHAEADELFRTHGLSVDRPHAAEGDIEYQRRILNTARRFSPSYAGFDFQTQPVAFLDTAWHGLVQDAVQEFKKPEGELRSITEFDAANRKIIRYYGDPHRVWEPFMGPVKHLLRFNHELFSGVGSPAARRARGEVAFGA